MVFNFRNNNWYYGNPFTTYQNLDNEIRETKGKVATDNCEHPKEERVPYFRCKVVIKC